MIIDVIDATETSDRHEISAIKNASGNHPIEMYGMCAAVEHMVRQVILRASRFNSIDLLRFHGHGASGKMNLAAGKEAHFQHHSGISSGNMDAVKGSLGELNPYFSRTARVELHGCNVAKGDLGIQFIKNLSKIWGVPVVAGVQSQYGGVGRQFVFEGLTRTALPNGSLQCESKQFGCARELHSINYGLFLK